MLLAMLNVLVLVLLSLHPFLLNSSFSLLIYYYSPPLRETWAWGGDERGEDVENASRRAYETNETRAVSSDERTPRERARENETKETDRRSNEEEKEKENERGGVYFLKQIGRSVGRGAFPFFSLLFHDESRLVDF